MSKQITTMLEYQALYYLQMLFPNRYASLQFVSGGKSPDLQDSTNSIGVEVTCVENGQEIIVFFNKYCGKNINEVPSRVLEKTKSNSYAFGCVDQKILVLFGPHAHEFVSPDVLSQESFEKTLAAAKKKIKKLNEEHFQIFNTNELFVFSDNTFSEACLDTLMKELIDYQKNLTHKYSTVYIKSPYTLFRCNLHNRQYQIIDISTISGDVIDHAFRSVGLEQ